MNLSKDKFRPEFTFGTTHDPARLEEYGRFQQHLVLLEDVGRIKSYIRAIGLTEPGNTVVDVGAGTGILGILALKHGFEHAYLIEPSRKMGAYARHLAEINGLGNRVTVIESTLEALDLDVLPKSIDLVVTETISSLLFGFGSWDVMPALARRTRNEASVIPLRGSLYVAPSSVELATRGPNVDGLAALTSAGVSIDLYEHTFRSGGNIYDKGPIARAVADGTMFPTEIAKFDFTKAHPISLEGGRLAFSETTCIRGVVAFWDLLLVDGKEPVHMGNLDPKVTSWYPYFIAFKHPIHLLSGEHLDISMRLVPIDSPYRNAFQLISGDKELTNVLYW